MLFIWETGNSVGDKMINIKALTNALVKNMLKIADDAQNLKRGNHDAAIDSAVKQLKEDYKKNDPIGDIDMNNIDLSKVTIIKENE